MGYLEIELLIVRDIAHQLEQAEKDHVSGFTEASQYRLGIVKEWCASLIARLTEKENVET